MAELFIGLMSGTSLDAVDAALVDLSSALPRTLDFDSIPIEPALRVALMALQRPGPDELDRAARAAIALTRVYAEVASRLLAARPQVIALGAHGQTVRHRPEAGYTIQLLDGALLAELTGTDVVCDFRSADIAAGGQGAPLVPAFHAGSFAHPTLRRAVVNIGGIANVSLLAAGEPVRGFDTGPGNMLLDHWCERHTGMPYDRDGAWAAGGSVDAAFLAALRTEPYFARTAPKSTGRDLFDAAWLDAQIRRLDCPQEPRSIQATLAELTALTIAEACGTFRADEVFVCGGGANNVDLIRRLRAACAPARVDTTAALGADPQAVEATAFAWLAACRVRGMPGNLPEVTGARGARVLGAIHRAPGRAS